MQKMRMNYLVGTTFFLLIGIFTIIKGYQLGLGHVNKPGPGFIFFLAALLLIILGILDLVANVLWKTNADKNRKEFPIWAGVRWQKILLVFGALLAYALLLQIFGFLFCTFLIMVFLFKAVEPTGWVFILVTSSITVFFSYLFFQILLNVPLPEGFWGF
jgi:putative tricarboxylic transport membrane protein